MVGDNLSNYKNIITLSAGSSEGLMALLRQIRLPYHIVSIYGLDGTHYAVINPSKKLRIIKKGDKNGSIK